MNTLTRERAIQAVNNIERQILCGKSYYSTNNIIWMGISFTWSPLAKSRGGTLKRNKSWGNIIYSYRDKKLTREEAIAEVTKPPALRQALIESEAVIECYMCGKIVVGEDALTAHDHYIYQHLPAITIRYENRVWASFYYRKGQDGKSIYLTLCPACMDNIFKAEYCENSLR